MAHIPSRHKEIFCLVTVDGDLRVGDRSQQKASIEAMCEVHSGLGIQGKTTWFVNEIDFHWMVEQPESLLGFVDSGECIGVHDHLDTHFADTYAHVFELMHASRSHLAGFFLINKREVPLLAHRNGCAIQSPVYYQVAIDLGYTLVSDVRPEMSWSARMVKENGQWICLNEDDPRSIFSDNRCIPLGIRPWYHNSQNWMDTASRQGTLLHVPITSMPGVIPERVTAAVENSNNQAFIVIDTHPYDLQDLHSGDLSKENLVTYQQSLLWIKEELDAQFIRLDQLPEKLLI